MLISLFQNAMYIFYCSNNTLFYILSIRYKIKATSLYLKLQTYVLNVATCVLSNCGLNILKNSSNCLYYEHSPATVTLHNFSIIHKEFPHKCFDEIL